MFINWAAGPIDGLGTDMSGLLFIIPALLVVYWVLARYSGLNGLQRGLALAVLVVFTELVSAHFWWPGSKILIRELVLGLLVAYLVGMLGYLRESRREKRKGAGLRGWGLAYVTALFALILGLNVGLLYISEQGLPSQLRKNMMPEPASTLTFPGLVSAEALPHQEVLRRYLRGLRRLGEQGWQMRESWSSGPTVGVSTTLSIGIERQDGSPLSGAELHMNVLSSVDGDRDLWLALKEAEAGIYQAELSFHDAGIWGLALRIDYDGETLQLLSTTDVSPFPRAAATETPK